MAGILTGTNCLGPHGTGTTDLDFSKFMEACFGFCCCLFLLQHFKVPKFFFMEMKGCISKSVLSKNVMIAI